MHDNAGLKTPVLANEQASSQARQLLHFSGYTVRDLDMETLLSGTRLFFVGITDIERNNPFLNA
jgi:hypothetical protein